MTGAQPQPIPRALLVMACVVGMAPLGWLYYQAYGITYDPMLWYLNWYPGSYSLHAFATSGLSKMLAVAALGVGVVNGLMARAPAAMGAGLAMCLMFSCAGDDGLSRRFAAWTGMASIACQAPRSSACQLNDFNRMYDLGWTRALEPGEAEQYQAYVTLRERPDGVEKLEALHTPVRLGAHQVRLRQWGRRAAPELAAILGRSSVADKVEKTYN